MNWPEGWLVTRKSDGRPGVVRNAWMQSEGDPDQEHWRVFVEALDVPQTFLSAGMLGEPASAYDGKPIHAPEIERKAGHRYMGKLPAYSELGGYPLIYLTKSNEVLCSDCATEQIDSGNDTDFDPVVTVDVHYEGPAEICANCNKAIDSTYGDPGETPEPEIREPESE